jgi:hypothetical protein
MAGTGTTRTKYNNYENGHQEVRAHHHRLDMVAVYMWPTGQQQQQPT